MRGDWGRPHRIDVEGKYQRWYSTPSCLDCEHFRVGMMFNRMCVQFPDRHMWGPCPPESERLETGRVEAEECGRFQLASEYLP